MLIADNPVDGQGQANPAAAPAGGQAEAEDDSDDEKEEGTGAAGGTGGVCIDRLGINRVGLTDMKRQRKRRNASRKRRKAGLKPSPHPPASPSRTSSPTASIPRARLSSTGMRIPIAQPMRRSGISTA